MKEAIEKSVLQKYAEEIRNMYPEELFPFIYIYEALFQTKRNVVVLHLWEEKQTGYEITLEKDAVIIRDEKQQEVSVETFKEKLVAILNNYNAICSKIGISNANPAKVELLKKAREIRENVPLKLKWIIKIKLGKESVEIAYPRTKQEIYKEECEGILHIFFNEEDKIVFKNEADEEMTEETFLKKLWKIRK